MWLPMVLFFSMAAKLIGPNLDLQFFKKNHFLDEVIVFGHLPCKGLTVGCWFLMEKVEMLRRSSPKVLEK